MLRKPSEIIINGTSLEELLKDTRKIDKIIFQQIIEEVEGTFVDVDVDDIHYDLSGLDLSYADLRGMNLRGVDLYSTNLTGANLSGADLRNANLECTKLSGTDLSYANLKNANLSGVDLSETDLKNVDLTNADLEYKYLADADFIESVNKFSKELLDTYEFTDEDL